MLLETITYINKYRFYTLYIKDTNNEILKAAGACKALPGKE